MTSRYREDPRQLEGKPDLGDILSDMRRRLSDGETAFRVGNTSIEDGNLIVRNGDIVVSETDETEVLKIMHGSVPEIRMFPISDPDSGHRYVIYAYDTPGWGTTGVHVIEYIDGFGDIVTDGAFIEFSQEYVSIGWEPEGSERMHFQMGDVSGANVDRFHMRGKWLNNVDNDANAALSTGTFAIGAGFGSGSKTYAFTMASDMLPIIGLQSSAAVSWNLTAYSTTGFTVSWSGTTAKNIHYWSFRV